MSRLNDARTRRDILDLVVRMNDEQRGTAARLRNPHHFWTRLAGPAPSTYNPGHTKQVEPLGVAELESLRDRISQTVRLGYEAITYIDRCIIEQEEGR